MRAVQARGFTDPQGVAAFYDSLRTASSTVAQADQSVCFVRVGQWIQAKLARFAKVGTKASALSGAYWYHAPGIADTGMTWPQTGRLSLLLTHPRNGSDSVMSALSALLRRLDAQFGAQGLSITVVTKTQGYWLRDGVNTGPVTPSQEAADDSAYLLNYLHLPITLVVQPTVFVRDTEHRLRQQGPVQFETEYAGYGGGDMFVLTDRTGHLIFTDYLEPEFGDRFNETRLTAYITRALTQR
jgi:hypothetical protein